MSLYLKSRLIKKMVHGFINAEYRGEGCRNFNGKWKPVERSAKASDN